MRIMMGLGTLLEKARLQQGLTIEEMSERTKIKPQFLLAIEEENFHELPGDAYVKPFVRTYAKALGLEDEIAISYEDSPTSISEEVMVELGIRERRERSRKARRRRFTFRVVFTLVIVGVGYLVYRLINV